MAITIAELTADIKSVMFTYDGFDVNIEYKPSSITPAFQSQMKKMDTTDAMNMVEAVKTMISGWDVMGSDGRPIEINSENLGALPINFVAKIVQSIFEDLNPKQEEKKV